jgi:hypothetical protein
MAERLLSLHHFRHFPTPFHVVRERNPERVLMQNMDRITTTNIIMIELRRRRRRGSGATSSRETCSATDYSVILFYHHIKLKVSCCGSFTQFHFTIAHSI